MKKKPLWMIVAIVLVITCVLVALSTTRLGSIDARLRDIETRLAAMPESAAASPARTPVQSPEFPRRPVPSPTFFVTGDIARPGTFTIPPNGITLSRALLATRVTLPMHVDVERFGRSVFSGVIDDLDALIQSNDIDLRGEDQITLTRSPVQRDAGGT